jgi:hypothetical protein
MRLKSLGTIAFTLALGLGASRVAARDAARPAGVIRVAPKCAGLDEQTCKATSSCTPDYCTACSCTPTFMGCRAPNDAKTRCPARLCAQPQCCKSSVQCGDVRICRSAEEGRFPGCGTCFQGESECASDSDCEDAGEAMICEVQACSCNAARACQPGCTEDSQCKSNEACGENHRCQTLTCGDDKACPAEFLCADGLCGRRSCKTDKECPVGFCVNGSCSRSLGMCFSPPAVAPPPVNAGPR